MMAHDVPLGCAPDEYDDLISGTCSHLPSANTAITTHDNNGNLLPNALRIQYDVDSDGRVQNVKILESTTTPEFEHKIIEKMMSKWRFEKGKPGIAKRVVVMSQPKSTGGPANKQ
ncbi:TonB family protein [Klebsiella pneumoniae]|nr:TonB family protein [Klebsiella pneumoniae]